MCFSCDNGLALKYRRRSIVPGCVLVYMDFETVKVKSGWMVRQLGLKCGDSTASFKVNTVHSEHTTELAVLKQMEQWIQWATSKGKTQAVRDDQVVLVAHNGLNHDFRFLAEMYVVNCMMPPRYRVSDNMVALGLLYSWRVSVSLDAVSESLRDSLHAYRTMRHTGLGDCYILHYTLLSLMRGSEVMLAKWLSLESIQFWAYFAM